MKIPEFVEHVLNFAEEESWAMCDESYLSMSKRIEQTRAWIESLPEPEERPCRTAHEFKFSEDSLPVTKKIKGKHDE